MATIMGTGTRMSEALYKLAAWLSPAYPVGAFSYSHGLEWAIGSGTVTNRETLCDWIKDCIQHGAGRNDAILLAAAYREPDNSDVADLAAALQPSRERQLETMAQGAAFAATTDAAWGGDAGDDVAYPVAVGRAAAAHEIPLADTIILFLQAFTANLASVGVRLIPLGQTEGQRIVADLMPVCGAVARQALAAELDDIGGATIMADIASMQHETQTVRLFRS
jgi:urease accessory protein